MPLLLLASAVAPAVVLLFYFRTRDAYATSSYLVWTSFALGATVAFPGAAVEFLVRPLVNVSENPYSLALLTAFFTVAVPEEAFKLLVLIIFSSRHVDCRKPHDVVVLAVAISAGFSAIETLVFYLADNEDWAAVAFLRSLSATPMHCFVGAIMGACVAMAMIGESRRASWVAAYAIPVALHGLYDYPVFVLRYMGSGSIPAALQIAGLCVLAAVVILFICAGVAFMYSRRVLSAERSHGISPKPLPLGTLLMWWVRRPLLHAAVWYLAGGLIGLTGFLLLVGGSSGRGANPEGLERILSVAIIARWIGLLLLLHGGTFLAQGLAVLRNKHRFEDLVR